MVVIAAAVDGRHKGLAGHFRDMKGRRRSWSVMSVRRRDQEDEKRRVTEGRRRMRMNGERQRGLVSEGRMERRPCW